LLQNSNQWSTKDLHNFQLEKLRQLFIRADRVPYYAKVFKNVGFNPRRLSSLSEISQLPLLDKNTIHQYSGDFPIFWPMRRLARQVSTGGSTGEPLQFIQSLVGLTAEQAFIDHIWSAGGFKPGMKMAIIRGNWIGKLHRMRVGQMLFISGYEHESQVMLGNIRALESFQPDFIHAYPSLLHRLACFILDNDVRIKVDCKAVFCGSEAIYPHQRDQITSVFKCPIITWYGQSEQVALATGCPDGSFVFFPQYSFVEFLPVRDDMYEIVGTGWLNQAFPFIRYRTGDLVSGIESHCFAESGTPVIRIKSLVGRSQHMVVLNDGTVTPLNHVIYSLHGDEWKNIQYFQFVQESQGQLLLLVVPKRRRDLRWGTAMTNSLRKKFGNLLTIQIEETEKLDSSNTLKFPYFVSQLPDKY